MNELALFALLVLAALGLLAAPIKYGWPEARQLRYVLISAVDVLLSATALFMVWKASTL